MITDRDIKEELQQRELDNELTARITQRRVGRETLRHSVEGNSDVVLESGQCIEETTNNSETEGQQQEQGEVEEEEDERHAPTVSLVSAAYLDEEEEEE